MGTLVGKITFLPVHKKLAGERSVFGDSLDMRKSFFDCGPRKWA